MPSTISLLKRFWQNRRRRNIAVAVLLLLSAAAVYFFISGNSGTGEITTQEINRLEESVKQDPHNPETRVALAIAYYRAGSNQRAIAQLNTALELNPQHQGAMLVLGEIYMETRRYSEAVPYFEQVIAFNAHNPMRGTNRDLQGAFYNLGVSYYNLGNLVDAEKTLAEGLAMDAADADSWYILGKTNIGLGQFGKAIECFEQAVRFVPNFREAYLGMEESYSRMGEEGFALYAQAMADYSSGLYGQAIEKLERVIAMHPDFAEAYLGLGLSLEEIGETDKAEAAFREVLKFDPENWLAGAKLGQ